MEANQGDSINGSSRCDNSNVTENGPTPSTSPKVVNSFIEKLRHGFLNSTLPAYDMKVFVKNGRALGFHKILFVSASSYFLDLFEQGILQNNGGRSVRVQMDPDVCKVIKFFLYTNCFPNGMTIEMALRVLESSIQYGIETLNPRIIDEVVRLMTPNDALNVLTTARSLELKNLEFTALDQIVRNSNEVLQHEGFLKLGLYDVQNILTSDNLNCKESVVFNAAKRWALNKSMNMKDEKQKSAFRYYFRKVAYFIRLPLMTPMELAEIVESNKDAMNAIGQSELLGIFTYVSLPVYQRTKAPAFFNCTQRNCNDMKCIRQDVGIQTESTDEDKRLPRRMDPDNGVLADRLIMPPPPSPPAVTLSNKRPYAESEVSVATTVNSPDSTVRGNKAARMAEQDSDDSDDDLFTRTAKIRDKSVQVYEDMFRRYHREPNNSDIGGFQITTNNNVANNYRPLVVKNCSEVVIDVKLNFLEGGGIKTFLNFIKHFDIMRYLVFNNMAPNPLTVEGLWSLKQDILLILSGVKFLKMCHSENELVLNYMKESWELLTNDEMRLTKLAVSNCEFSLKALKHRSKLEELILYRVWGEFGLEEFINDCPNLSKLICWKFVPTPWLTGSLAGIPPCLAISTNFLTKTSLKKLVLYRTELKLVGTARIQAGTNISELFLDRCHTKYNSERSTSVLEVFNKIFPRLEKLMIVEELCPQMMERECGNIATSEMLNMVRKKIASIAWIRIVGLKWSSSTTSADSRNSVYLENEDGNLNDFLNELGLPDKCHNFLLEKTETWKGTNHQILETESLDVDGGYWSSFDEMEFNLYELENFYKNYEVYEEFFVQDDERQEDRRRSKTRNDNFPRPVMWY